MLLARHRIRLSITLQCKFDCSERLKRKLLILAVLLFIHQTFFSNQLSFECRPSLCIPFCRLKLHDVMEGCMISIQVLIKVRVPYWTIFITIPGNVKHFIFKYCFCRNKRPPKTVIFQRGEYTKPMAFDGCFFKGGSTQNWWAVECFLLRLKIKRPGRLFWQIR